MCVRVCVLVRGAKEGFKIVLGGYEFKGMSVCASCRHMFVLIMVTSLTEVKAPIVWNELTTIRWNVKSCFQLLRQKLSFM